jgi:prophage tail gpP-like protein
MHIVKKLLGSPRFGKREYLYVQKYVRKSGKKGTQHVLYLGSADIFDDNQVQHILELVNKKKMKQAKEFIAKCKSKSKHRAGERSPSK